MALFAPFNKLKRSFRARIFYLLTLFVFVITAISSTYFLVKERSQQKARLNETGDIIVQLLAHNARLGLFSEQPEMLRQASEGIFDYQQVISITFYAADGRTVLEQLRTGQQLPADSKESVAEVLRIVRIFSNSTDAQIHHEKDDLISFFAPIVVTGANSSGDSIYFSEQLPVARRTAIGLVKVTLDKTALNKALVTQVAVHSFMAFLFILAGSVLIFLTTESLMGPLSSLMEGVKGLAAGNHGVQIPVTSTDELGEIAAAFNEMTLALADRERQTRNLEEQLRHAQQAAAREEWEQTFDTVPDLIALLDSDQRIVQVNKPLAERLGISKGEAIGALLQEKLSNPATANSNRSLAELMEAGATYFEDEYHELLKGYFSVSVSPLKEIPGREGCSVFVARDITTRKLAEDALRKAQDRFKLIAETIAEVVWMADVNLSTMLYISPGYERVWGCPLEKLNENPKSFISAVHPDDRASVLQTIRGKDGEQPFEVEYRIVRPDGSLRWIWDRGYPVHGEGGKVICYTGVAEDITERKKAAEEKHEFQAKLVQTNKMASLGFLVSGLTHEVNNPNNNIKLTSHLMARSWQDMLPVLEKQYREEGDYNIGGLAFLRAKEVIPQHIESIRDNSRRIERIIKNLRDYVRLGRAESDSPAEINNIVTIAATILNTQIKEHTMSFKLALAPDLPLVTGNPQQLEQVFVNLIMNAVQSLSKRKASVRVATSFEEASGFVMVSVTDEGEGMTKELLARICEPFFSTKLDRGGTGLGLAITNHIVKEHHGLLEFDSLPGKGTTVRVRLPAAPRPLASL